MANSTLEILNGSLVSHGLDMAPWVPEVREADRLSPEPDGCDCSLCADQWDEAAYQAEAFQPECPRCAAIGQKDSCFLCHGTGDLYHDTETCDCWQ
jgi:hypothetical protein